MKKLGAIILSFGLLLSFSVGSSHKVEAKTKAVKYKNCTALNKVYKGGVSRSASVKNKGGKTKYKPFVSKDLYDTNSGLDRDKDLIACEK